jgi:DNA-binding LacI/PurR family transcriptional regulator
MDAAERVRGWSAVLGEHGLPAREPLVGDWSPGSGYMHGRVLARDTEMTAVFVSNDQMAIGVMHALAEAGHSVPGDVSVVGFDDIPEAAYFTPPLTTVRQDFDALGRDAMAGVLAVLGDDVRLIPTPRVPDLIVRTSTSAPSRDRTALTP